MVTTKDFDSETANAIRGADWVLDHVAHAVLSLDSAISFYQNTCGFTVLAREQSLEQQVDAAFINLGSAELELIAPLNGQGPIQRFIEKRGSGLHHICFRVNSIEKELQRLEQSGFELIDRTPRLGLRNKRIAFIHPRSTYGALIELCSKK